MHQRKSKKILIYFFLLILVGSINNNSINNLKLEKVKNVNIFGLEKKDQKIILYNLNNLDLKNIFFINKRKFQNIIESNSLVEEYNVIKKYPDSINKDGKEGWHSVILRPSGSYVHTDLYKFYTE